MACGVGVLCQLILTAIFFVLQLAGAALVRAPPKVLLPMPCVPLGLGVAAFHQPSGSLVADGHADALEARYFLRPWGDCVVLTERRLAARRMQWGRLPVS